MGDQLGFCFKAADEIWLVGEFRQYDLYCDLSVNVLLSGKINSTVGSFTDRFKQIIAFNGSGSVSDNTALLHRKYTLSI